MKVLASVTILMGSLMSFVQSCVPEVIVSLPCRRIMMMAYRLTQLNKTPTAILRQHHQLSSRLLVRALMREQECTKLPTACGSPGIAQCTGSSAGQAAFSEADAQSSIRMLFESSQSYADIMEPDSRPRQHDLPACTGCGSSWECSSTRRGFDC